MPDREGHKTHFTVPDLSHISTRVACPFCGTPLSGKIEKVKNDYKLDNGDPDYRERTLCPNCSKYVFTIASGRGLEPGYK